MQSADRLLTWRDLAALNSNVHECWHWQLSRSVDDSQVRQVDISAFRERIFNCHTITRRSLVQYLYTGVYFFQTSVLMLISTMIAK